MIVTEQWKERARYSLQLLFSFSRVYINQCFAKGGWWIPEQKLEDYKYKIKDLVVILLLNSLVFFMLKVLTRTLNLSGNIAVKVDN